MCVDSALCFGPDGTCRSEPAAAGTSCDDSAVETMDDQCDGSGTCISASKALKAAVVKCLGESATGDCECAGTSCSPDPRFRGQIGTWDVSGVKSMAKLFEANASFVADISAWDTSSVTDMGNMCVHRLRKSLE